MERVGLRHLLDLGAALFRLDDAAADRRRRTVPEAPAGVFLQRAEHVFGVLPRLILVERRHDLTHHDVHRIVAGLPRHGNELGAVLRQLADIKLKLEMVAERTAEGMDDEAGFLRRAFEPAAPRRGVPGGANRQSAVRVPGYPEA